jgi:dipeptidyl aminopeptidase/acylaminoacyl peptidase
MKLALPLILAAITGATMAQDRSTDSSPTYQKAPPAMQRILDAPPLPSMVLSPARDHYFLVQGESYPTIAELAQPMLRLAGARINPITNGPYMPERITSLTLRSLAGAEKTSIALPTEGVCGSPTFSPDGKRFFLTCTTDRGIDLWHATVAEPELKKLDGLAINGLSGGAVWMPDSKTLAILAIPEGRQEMPKKPAAPAGPMIQESYGRLAPTRTFQDLLRDSHDEALYEHFFTSQIWLVDLDAGARKKIAAPAIYSMLDPSPSGEYLLVSQIHRPYSYVLTMGSFPRLVEVWGLDGKPVAKVADLPLADEVPIEGVPKGPRGYRWVATEPATLLWTEALDDGDPKKKVPHRDQMKTWAAPFASPPQDWRKVEHRFAGVDFTQDGKQTLVREYDRDRKWSTTWRIAWNKPDAEPHQVWSLSVADRYGDPGTPIRTTLPSGHRALLQKGNAIFLAGDGATDSGDRPFLDEFDLESHTATRRFQSDAKALESTAALVSAEKGLVITRHESPTSPPNYILRNLSDGSARPLTENVDPAPELRRIKKELVTYKRADDVQCSFTLYLPPDYKPGERLPTVVWAYPREFTDADTASQVSGSPNRFTSLRGTSHLFLLLHGYAILDSATMPVVGPPETANNTFIEQIVSSAQAAIDKATEMGVTDPNRVCVGGHSYGAFMTANLMAHSDLFRAGVARSGAYNRTLTPFGFQSERRTLWEAPEIYAKLSPFTYANKIKDPLLIIHGELDNNPGTFPVQSERLYQAIRGNGGNVRYVVLPLESHGYSARESIEHTLFEMANWFDQHVKNAAPRETPSATGAK